MMMTEPASLPIAGTAFPVLFNLWAVRKLEERYSPVGDWLESGLQGFIQAQTKLAAGDIDALAAFLWAGLLHDSPSLTFDDALGLLDEAAPGELVTIPAQMMKAVLQAVGRKNGGGGGEPWSWSVAMAAWVSEWGRSEQEFWLATFRTIGTISDGRAHLYRKAGQGSQVQAPSEGYSLLDLLSMKGR